MAWRREQGRDRFFRRAKAEGFRARSVYKLREIAEKHRLLAPGARVLDLGAAPGSWSQLAATLVGPPGRVVAVDLQPIAPIPGVKTLVGDIRLAETLERAQAELGGPADVVLSDVAPATTGIAVTDHARSIELASAALAVAEQTLRPGGALVVKVFRGPDFDQFLGAVRQRFGATKVAIPEATRKESREAFIVGLGYRGREEVAAGSGGRL
ncbi:MAG: RlmE family RNA methyltransferase [Chloroflexi bacterium]|nr:RlmE family RNA methyltransferase [Chloroflexota bacterium]